MQMITPDTIIKDISEALDTTDLVPDFNHNRKDYLSYRYRWNDTRPIVRIRIYNKGHYEIGVGKKCYDITDGEIYGALKPLIIKTVKKIYDAACAEIAYRDDEMTVVLRKKGLIMCDCDMTITLADVRYSAEYHRDHDSIRFWSVPLEFAGRYMELVNKYFLPFVEKYREAK